METAHGRYLGTRFFGSLDGLRALSILAVIWHHTAPASLGARFSLLHEGNQGVTLFFVISGFLIVTLLLRAKARHDTFSLVKFWGRRSLRILPVYYAVLGVYAALVWLLEKDPAARQAFFGNLPAFATFTSNWFVHLDSPRVIFYFAWSLAAEEQFYLVWPWLERWLRGARPLIAALLLIGLVQAAKVAVYPINPDVLGLPLRILVGVPLAILLGVVLAHALHHPAGFRCLHALVGRRGGASAAALLTLAVLALRPWLGPMGDLATGAAMLLLVAACVVREDHDFTRVLTLRRIAWIGQVSYAMYLIHMLCVNQVRLVLGKLDAASPYLDFVGGTLLAIALASLSHRFFEGPLLRLKDRFFNEERRPTITV